MLHTGVTDFDLMFGGIPKGGMTVFAVEEVGYGGLIGRVFLPSLDNCFLVDAKGGAVWLFQEAIRKRLIKLKGVVDVNLFEVGRYQELLEDYLRETKDESKNGVHFINGLQEFFMGLRDKSGTILEYGEKGFTTIGVLYIPKDVPLNKRFEQEIKKVSGLIIGVEGFIKNENILHLNVWKNDYNEVKGDVEIKF